jgi:ABC-2 type transport system permease protein
VSGLSRRFGRLVIAELEKLATVWSTYVLLAAVALAAGLLGLVIGLGPHRHGVDALLFAAPGTVRWYDQVFSALTISQDFALVLGILVITGEYRHKTVTPVYLGEPRRGFITAAKLLVSAAGGLLAAVAGLAGSLVLGFSLVWSGYGNVGEMLGRFSSYTPGILLAAILFGIYGLGLGALLRNQVVALVVGLGVTAIVEPIVVAVWPSVGRFMPSEAARVLEPAAASGAASGGGITGRLANPISGPEAILVLLCYGIVLAIAGSLTTLRSDIT